MWFRNIKQNTVWQILDERHISQLLKDRNYVRIEEPKTEQKEPNKEKTGRKERKNGKQINTDA